MPIRNLKDLQTVAKFFEEAGKYREINSETVEKLIKLAGKFLEKVKKKVGQLTV